MRPSQHLLPASSLDDCDLHFLKERKTLRTNSFLRSCLISFQDICLLVKGFNQTLGTALASANSSSSFQPRPLPLAFFNCGVFVNAEKAGEGWALVRNQQGSVPLHSYINYFVHSLDHHIQKDVTIFRQLASDRLSTLNNGFRTNLFDRVLRACSKESLDRNVQVRSVMYFSI